MSHGYRAVGWNRQKKVYDTVLVSCVGLYLFAFVALNRLFYPEITVETLMIRATGTAALFLLHVILSIGPLCRLDPRFLPLLYNRRHMGVTMFVLAFIHGTFSLIQFHFLGDMNPVVSVFLSNTHYTSLVNFPFQPLGFVALIILFLMAVTSHDFWLANLTPPVWKGLHMMVYIAYALIIFHVTLGVLQAETSPVLASVLGVGLIGVLSLHVIAGLRSRPLDREVATPSQQGFVEVCGIEDIPDQQGKVFCLTGERYRDF